MRSIILKTTETYPSYILMIGSNNFGDQVLQIRFENKQGFTKYVWTEINHEGLHREINEAFIERLKALVEIDGPSIEKKYG